MYNVKARQLHCDRLITLLSKKRKPFSSVTRLTSQYLIVLKLKQLLKHHQNLNECIIIRRISGQHCTNSLVNNDQYWTNTCFPIYGFSSSLFFIFSWERPVKVFLQIPEKKNHLWWPSGIVVKMPKATDCWNLNYMKCCHICTPKK